MNFYIMVQIWILNRVPSCSGRSDFGNSRQKCPLETRDSSVGGKVFIAIWFKLLRKSSKNDDDDGCVCHKVNCVHRKFLKVICLYTLSKASAKVGVLRDSQNLFSTMYRDFE
jgi:hypothetical protein